MSGVRVLVGTRKGEFVLTSNSKRERWDIKGPHFGGWEIYHLKGSPVDPNRLYASQCSGWFRQLIQHSDDGGKTWKPVGNKFVYDGVPGTHLWYDGTPHPPWEFKRVWHLETSLTDPDTVYAGVEGAAMFRSKDGGQTWQELPGLHDHRSGARWQPGAGGMGQDDQDECCEMTCLKVAVVPKVSIYFPRRNDANWRRVRYQSLGR